jgi:hypothetical protein
MRFMQRRHEESAYSPILRVQESNQLFSGMLKLIPESIAHLNLRCSRMRLLKSLNFFPQSRYLSIDCNAMINS